MIFKIPLLVLSTACVESDTTTKTFNDNPTISIMSHSDGFEALEEEGIEYQSFTMSRLGHEYGEAEDMKVHLPVMKNFILGEL